MFVVHRMVRGSEDDSWWWNRGFPIAAAVFAPVFAFVTLGVKQAIGVDIVHEIVRALEHASDVSIAFSGAALAAGLVGLTLIAPATIERSADGETSDPGLRAAAICLAVTTFSATAEFAAQWFFAAFGDLSENVRAFPAMFLLTFLVILVDGLLGTPFWIVRLLQTRAN
ncbi:hypothetical protein [Candidatus Poriferisodalis sp.]|uniref:hypothetical protein n=1 Tax=Candidatus Poriferisodalis sp. TaxID=3101277 RepID=UPI003B0163A9